MKRFVITFLTLLTLSTGFIALPASAAINLFPAPACDSQSKPGDKTVVCQQNAAQTAAKENPVIRALRVTIRLMSIVVGVSALIGFIIAGLNIITSNGDSQKVAKSRSAVIYITAALVIVGLADVIVSFVLRGIQ